MAPSLLATSAVFAAEATRAAETTKTDHKRRPQTKNPTKEPQYKWELVWRNIIAFVFLHVAGLYGFYLIITTAKWATVIWYVFFAQFGGQGVTSGAHRLWAHKTYKAKLPLRIILAFAQTTAFQNHIFEWVRDHRVHHKYTDTDADPHNAKRGFFFSHMGWLCLKKHKDVKEKGKTVEMSDLEADPVVMFQKKYYGLLMPLCCFVLPTYVPWYIWNESLHVSWYCCLFRYMLILHITWFVNSAAHMFGNKPYDRNIGPSENKFVSFVAAGEGWHNYHHVFPWDYKAAELGFHSLNVSTGVIDFFARVGWVYDRKTASEEIIRNRAARTGDGTWSGDAGHVDDGFDHHHYGDGVWGWGDKDMKSEDVDDVRKWNELIGD